MSAYLEAMDAGRCNHWRLRVDLWQDGKRQRYSKRFEGGKREAERALKEFEAECEARPLASYRLPEYMRSLSRSRYAAGLIEKNTLDQYWWAARVLEGVLDYPLADITPEDVRRALAEIEGGKTPSGRSLSAKSRLHLVKCGRSAYCEAMRSRLAPSNPFEGVVIPQPKTERLAASSKAVGLLLESLGVESAAGFAVSLIARSGLRASEALGLCWSDLLEGALFVRREITKTDAGVRRVPLNEADLEYIDERRQFLERRLKKCGGVLEDSDRLCCGNDGRPLTYNALRLWWSRHRDGLGFTGYTLHELRHTYLTNLAQAGVHPSVMQRLAGHSSVKVSLEIYTHAQDEDMREAVEALGALRK